MGLGNECLWAIRQREHLCASLNAHFRVHPHGKLCTNAAGPTLENSSGATPHDFTGTVNELNYCSIVVPIDLEQGVLLNAAGNDAYCYTKHHSVVFERFQSNTFSSHRA